MQLHLGEYIQSGWLSGKNKEGVEMKFCKLIRFLPDGQALEIMCHVKPEEGNVEMLSAIEQGYKDLCEYTGKPVDSVAVDKL